MFLWEINIHYVALDGKAMQASNHLEGYKCWLCTSNTVDNESLNKVDSVAIAHNLPLYCRKKIHL
jgi:hypothetical protein